MNRLIVGGAGFIGSVLVKEMLTDHSHVIIIDKLSLGDVTKFYYSVNKLKDLGLTPRISTLEAIQKAAKDTALQQEKII
jgi:UDP-glucose 4-epimerase